MKKIKLLFSILIVIAVFLPCIVSCGSQSDYGTLVLVLPGQTNARATGDPVSDDIARTFKYRVDCTRSDSTRSDSTESDSAINISQTFNYSPRVSLTLAEGLWRVTVTVLDDKEEIGSAINEEVLIKAGSTTNIDMTISVKVKKTNSGNNNEKGYIYYVSKWEDIPWNDIGLSDLNGDAYGDVIDYKDYLTKELTDIDMDFGDLKELVETIENFLEGDGSFIDFMEAFLILSGEEDIESQLEEMRNMLEQMPMMEEIIKQRFLTQNGTEINKMLELNDAITLIEDGKIQAPDEEEGLVNGYIIALSSDGDKKNNFISAIKKGSYEYFDEEDGAEIYWNDNYKCFISIALEDEIMYITVMQYESDFEQPAR